MSTESDDLFDDETVKSSEETSFDKEDETETKEAKADEDEKVEESEGDKQSAEPPNAEKDSKDEQPDKMIPEKRFKAAIKDVNDKLDKAEAELAQLKAQPAPDKDADPEGYEQHMRIETSKYIMADAFPDYNEKIKHFQEMAEASPELNAIVAKHRNPAKMAYDLAKKDMEIQELAKLRDSDEWKEFQEFKAAKVKGEQPEQAKPGTKPINLATKVPNLNRATNVAKNKSNSQDDDLFKGHYSHHG